jgi:hypothetical protein
MNLYKTAEKEKMVKAYHAYLENTPGSKKALEELLNKKFQLASTDNSQDVNNLEATA